MMLLLVLLFQLIICSVVTAWKDNDCPCENPEWCKPISIPLYTRKEVYAFTLQEDSWQYFDWDVITTVAHSFETSSSFWKSNVCLAHSHNARVVFTTVMPEALLQANTTFDLQNEWVQNQADHVEALGGDGINVDYENEINADEKTKRQQLTFVTQLLQIELKKRNSFSSLVWDLGWKPNVDERYYDYKRISDICDYVFVMIYDTQSQIESGPPCLAGPNSPLSALKESLVWYSSSTPSSIYNLNVPYEKIILGLPWYGYYYNCTSYDPLTEECVIPTVPFRGVECSDAAGSQLDYPFTMKELRDANIQPVFDLETLSMKAFATKATLTASAASSSSISGGNTTVAYYFDSPESVKAKVAVAWNLTTGRIGGVGMWNADVPNYTDPNEGQSFWNSMILPPANKQTEMNIDQVK
mmetsp:Transcript_10791/g.25756  ORF Transcript_10791/g.25756 Transcript_10791/m.25756 type:complete len:413 (+) Transcript_10791:124-1362(+)